MIFNEYLGLDYDLVITKTQSYRITTGVNTLVIGNQLFNTNLDSNYISSINLPKTPIFKTYNELGNDLPVLFGMDSFDCSKSQIKIGSDIIAACFFMLTRWEEIVEKEKDNHQRSIAKNSIASKWGFLHRPIVDEYADLIWKCLVHLGYQGTRKKQNYELIITHDVDEIQKWDSSSTATKTVAGDILKRKSLKLAQANLKQIKATKKGLIKDPYDTFEELMDLSETKGVKSHFFFLHYGTHENDQNYSWDNPHVAEAIEKITKRGHHVGLHPSYNTFNNLDLLQTEKTEFESKFNKTVSSGRQHYLRFETPTTWQNWEDVGMTWDSTMYYSETLGFRCGTCRDFPVFNVLTKKTLALRELPLTFMDITFFKRIENNESEELLTELKSYINTVRKHGGTFIMLWHTNYLNLNVFEKHKAFYMKALELL